MRVAGSGLDSRTVKAASVSDESDDDESAAHIFRLNEDGSGPELVREILLEKGWREFDAQTDASHAWNVWWTTKHFRPSDYRYCMLSFMN